MPVFERRIRDFLGDLCYVKDDDNAVDKINFLGECAIRFLQKNLSDNKIIQLSDKIGVDVNELRTSILAILHICMNTFEHKEKGYSALKDILTIWTEDEEFRTAILQVFDSILSMPENQQLLEKSIQLSTKGTYQSSSFRMDIDISQRTLNEVSSPASFLLRLQVSSENQQYFRFSCDMLEKFSKDLDSAIQAMHGAKRAKV